jgi:tetratricopeptide (TPR) repeat protein
VGFDSRRQEGEGRLLLRRWALPAAMTSFFVVASLADVPAWKNDLAIEKAEYQADPNFLPAVAGWAFTLHREGRANEALPKYNLVLSHFFSENSTPEEKVALTRTPWMLRRVKSYSSLRYQPIDFIGQMFRGRGGTKQMTGRYDDAIQDYRVAFALHPDDYEIADWMTQCYEMNGRFRDAEAHLKEVVARAPNGPRFFSLGKIYYRQGRWLEARNTFAQALAHTPSQDTTGMKAILSWYQRADTFWSIESKPHAP